jgi:hypothetical protein
MREGRSGWRERDLFMCEQSSCCLARSALEGGSEVSPMAADKRRCTTRSAYRLMGLVK